jgi:hypothetical protein
MMSLSRRLSIKSTALICALGACTTEQPSTSKPAIVPVQDNLAPPAEPYAKDRPEVSLGAPCKPDDVEHCGTAGRVSVTVFVRTSPNQRPAAPCEMKPTARPASGDITSACVKDDRIYLSAACTECRQYAFWDMTGIVAEMTDRQLANAQQRMGFPSEPLLRSADSWKISIAGAAARAARSNR